VIAAALKKFEVLAMGRRHTLSGGALGARLNRGVECAAPAAVR
jgi:hypothetical protein